MILWGTKCGCDRISQPYLTNAYCPSQGYSSSNSRRKNPRADSITLQELSDRQPVSGPGTHLVQRAQLRTWANRFGDKGQHCSVSPYAIHSQRKRTFLSAAVQLLPQAPFPFPQLNFCCHPSFLILCHLNVLCGSQQLSVRYFLSSLNVSRFSHHMSKRQRPWVLLI